MALSATDDFKTFLIKSSQGTPQQLKKRQKYEALPSFTKAGLYYQPNFVSVRQQGIPQRISACEILKSKGTRHFVNNDIAEAIQEYQKVNIRGLFAISSPLPTNRHFLSFAS